MTANFTSEATKITLEVALYFQRKRNVEANHILNFIHSSKNVETLQILFNG